MHNIKHFGLIETAVPTHSARHHRLALQCATHEYRLAVETADTASFVG
jgi:hypothetical protein